MTNLPLKRLILYKHGVGYFERRGPFEGTELSLSFTRDAMDDVLKSLVVLELGNGTVRGIDYERPESWSGRRIELSYGRALRDALNALRGRSVRIGLSGNAMLEGLILGLDEPSNEEPMSNALLTIYQAETNQMTMVKLNDIRAVQLRDTAADEVAWSLQSGNTNEQRTARIQLDEGQHELLVAYLAPAPSWRVSYRLIVENLGNESPDLLLQGWGLFDNVLDEDLNDVRLTLVAGRPVSFRYSLYEPKQPERPMLEDEVPQIAPVPQAAKRGFAGRMMMAGAAPAPMAYAASAEMADAFSMEEMVQAAPAAAEGSSQGALFRYDVREPVNVGRGRSALVPLLNLRTNCRRELVHRGQSGQKNPMVTVRFDNSSGLVLERGPATVIEGRSYGGEAVVNWTAEGGKVAVRYAQALELSVREDRQVTQTTRRLRLGRDALIHEIEEAITTIYTAANNAGEERTVTIEHPRQHPYELFDTVQPSEQTSELATWQLPVPARGESALRVRERRLILRREEFRAISFEQLRKYLQDRMLDQSTVTELRDILNLYARLDEITVRYQQIEAQRQVVYNQQTQIRGNLDVLKNDGGEGELRNRYIATLSQSEDQLTALRDEELKLREEERSCRQQLDERLSKIEQ